MFGFIICYFTAVMPICGYLVSYVIFNFSYITLKNLKTDFRHKLIFLLDKLIKIDIIDTCPSISKQSKLNPKQSKTNKQN